MLDWYIFEGVMILPRVVGIVSGCLIITILVCVIFRQHGLDGEKKSVLSLFVLIFVTSGAGWSIWSEPFQAVVSTFWLIYVAAIFTACQAAISRRSGLLWTIAAFILGTLAIFSHGSGFLAVVLMPLPLAVRGRWARYVGLSLALAVIFLVGSLFERQVGAGPETVSSPALTATMTFILDQPLAFARAVAAFAGAVVTNDVVSASVAGAAAMGVAGLLLARLTWRCWHRPPLSRLELLGGVLTLSGIASAALAAGLRLTWMAETLDRPVDYAFFTASRYVLASASIWIGAAVLLVSAFSQRVVAAGLLTVCAVVLISGHTVARQEMRAHAARMDYARIAIQSRLYEGRAIELTFPDAAAAVRANDFAARTGKGPFARPLSIGQGARVAAIDNAFEVAAALGGTICFLTGRWHRDEAPRRHSFR